MSKTKTEAGKSRGGPAGRDAATGRFESQLTQEEQLNLRKHLNVCLGRPGRMTAEQMQKEWEERGGKKINTHTFKGYVRRRRKALANRMPRSVVRAFHDTTMTSVSERVGFGDVSELTLADAIRQGLATLAQAIHLDGLAEPEERVVRQEASQAAKRIAEAVERRVAEFEGEADE